MYEVIVYRDSEGLGARGWTTEVGLPAGIRDFSLHDSIQTGSGSTQPHKPMGTTELLPQEKGCPEMKLATHLHVALSSRMVEKYLHSPTHLHGVVLN
jgi:hypothetical protein